ncbi:MAG: hypothetical protein ACOX39_07840 [Arcobacteraceae bacterium]
MERRNRSIKALSELVYIDSLDDELRASGLFTWVNKYLSEDGIASFDLENKDLIKLSELIYKNLTFLKSHNHNIAATMIETQKIKQFMKSKE